MPLGSPSRRRRALVEGAPVVHANLRFTFGRLARLIGTPRFHHWHHSAQPEAVDKNFAIHLPVIDSDPVPDSYARQLVLPCAR